VGSGSLRRGQRRPCKRARTSFPPANLREAYAKIRELERALGRKTMEVEILRAAQEVGKKNRRCAGRPHGDPLAPHDDLPRLADRAADGLLREPGPAGRAISPDGRPDRLGADPRGDEQPRDLRLSPCGGDGESDLPRRLQPRAYAPAPR